jgi:hypothetical protein
MKKIILFYCFFLLSCNKSNNSSSQDVIKLNSTDLELLRDDYNNSEFKAPKGLFKKLKGYEFISNELNIKIDLLINSYSPYDVNFIGSKNELIEKFKKDITITSIKINNDSFEIIGKEQNNLIFLKGFFNLIDGDNGSGNEEINYTIYRSQSAILKMQCPIEKVKYFDKLIPIFRSSFKCNFGEF